MFKIFLLLVTMIIVFGSCQKENSKTGPVIIQGAGQVDDEIDAFRNLLGDPLNNTTGVIGGRREIDWDSVPGNLLGQALPEDFFNPTEAGAPLSRQRGLAYFSNGEFRVSDDGFGDINESAGRQFSAFSGDKIFANISSIDWEIEFEVPGQDIGASVKGFGAVFIDVDDDSTVSLEFFNGAKSLARLFVPRHSGPSAPSFLGVYFNNGEVITRIRVRHQGRLIENSLDVSEGGVDDLVALDNFFYDEPISR